MGWFSRKKKKEQGEKRGEKEGKRLSHQSVEPDLAPSEAPPDETSSETSPSENQKMAVTPPVPHEAVQSPVPQEEISPKTGLFSRLKRGLQRSSNRLGSLVSQRKLDPQALEELEDELIAADLGVTFAQEVVASLSQRAHRQGTDDPPDALALRTLLARLVEERLQPFEAPLTLGTQKPQILVFVGVNGAGKTTVLGKIAAQFQQKGLKVLVAACDTFRAAAIEQIQAWAKRAGVAVEARHQGADAAGLAYDACARAQREDFDLVLIDTAGRLHNRRELMDELAKIIRAIKKFDTSAPHHVLLVLDATVGQNALLQAKAFGESAGVTGLIMNKLDGTAKGGVLVALSDQQKLPIHAIGVGEDLEDLTPFNAHVFARALVGLDEDKKTSNQGRG